MMLHTHLAPMYATHVVATKYVQQHIHVVHGSLDTQCTTHAPMYDTHALNDVFMVSAGDATADTSYLASDA